jgi:hypothetical protein
MIETAIDVLWIILIAVLGIVASTFIIGFVFGLMFL